MQQKKMQPLMCGFTFYNNKFLKKLHMYKQKRV